MPDITVQSVNSVSVGIGTKPVYLLSLDNKSKNKTFFIAIDRLDLQASFVQVKGFFVAEDTDALNNLNSVLTKTPKDDIVEVIFPWSKVHYIRNLIFKVK